MGVKGEQQRWRGGAMRRQAEWRNTSSAANIFSVTTHSPPVRPLPIAEVTTLPLVLSSIDENFWNSFSASSWSA